MKIGLSPHKADIWVKTLMVAGLFLIMASVDFAFFKHVRPLPFLSLQSTFAMAAIIVLILNFSRELKKCKITDLSLKAKDGQLEAFLNNLPEIAWLQDDKAQYLLVNHAFINECGASITDIKGKTSFDVWSQEIASKFAVDDERIFRTKKTVHAEQPIIDENGVQGWMEITKSPVFDDNKNVIGIVGIARDITERKNAEQEKKQLESQIRQAQKMEAIGTLAGGIAHDFNNILAAIMGFVEISMEEVPKESPMYNRLERILKSSHRGKDLIHQIMTFSRQHQQELKPVNLGSILEEALKLLRPLIPSTIEISSFRSGSSNTILSDATQMHQVLMNLCTNSAYAMRESGGRLELRVEDIELNSGDAAANGGLSPGAYVQLTVSDTGPGLDSKIIPRIFEPFFTTKHQGDGTGMGLAVVHGIINSLNGTILVDSDIGKGTTFRIFIPRIESDWLTTEPIDTIYSTGNERILLVDDESEIVEMAREMLEKLGYQVVSTQDSLKALSVFRRQHDTFHLVITDQTMPKMAGGELAQEMLNIRPDIPIILCTGFSEVVSQEEAANLGIKEYIMKPFMKNELAQTVRRVLDGTI